MKAYLRDGKDRCIQLVVAPDSVRNPMLLHLVAPTPQLKLSEVAHFFFALEIYDGQETIYFPPVVVCPLPNDQFVWMNMAQEDAVHVFLTTSPATKPGMLSVTAVAVTVYPHQPFQHVDRRIAATALRVEHILQSADLSDDALAMSAAHEAHAAANTGPPLIETKLGQRMLTAHVAPSDAISANLTAWARLIADQAVRGRDHTTYRAEALDFDTRLIEGRLSDGWTGLKERIRRLLPNAETIATLKQINRKGMEVGASIKNSKTAKALVDSLVGSIEDASRAETFAKAILGDMKVDTTIAGTVLINNADQVEVVLKRAITKLKDLKPADLDAYGAQVRTLLQNEQLRGGLNAVLKTMRGAFELWKKAQQQQRA